MRPYDAGTPTLADFEWYLQRATEGATYTCTGLWQEVLDALDDVATAAPDVPKALLDAAMDAYLAQVTAGRGGPPGPQSLRRNFERLRGRPMALGSTPVQDHRRIA